MKFERKYISSVVCVIQFKSVDNKVRHRAADAEIAFADIFPGQSQQTNVPDNIDPNLPRFVFQIGKKQLTISQKACQLILDFDNDGKTVDEQLSIVRKNLLAFQKGVLKFKSKNELTECAIVIGVSIPCKEGRDSMLQHVYRRFFKEDQQSQFGELASYSFKVGYKTTDQLYLNYETDIYELRKLELPQPAPIEQMAYLNVIDIPLVEEGISVRVDVNNRSKIKTASYTYSGIEELIPVAFSFIVDKIDNMIGIN